MKLPRPKQIHQNLFRCTYLLTSSLDHVCWHIVTIQSCFSPSNLLPPTKRAISARLSYKVRQKPRRPMRCTNTLIKKFKLPDAPQLLLKVSTAWSKDSSIFRCLSLLMFCLVCIAHKLGQSDIYCSFSPDHLSYNSKTYWEWMPLNWLKIRHWPNIKKILLLAVDENIAL